MKTIEQIQAELDAKIPLSAVQQRDGGGGRSLSYLEGHYVIDRMNQVFGHTAWDYKIQSLTKVYDNEIEKNGRTGRAVAYTCVVLLTVYASDAQGQRIPLCQYSDVGAGKGIDYSSGGIDADESATKEAVTDAVKRCCKNLGQSMGLALYDKTQKNVADAEEDLAQESPTAKKKSEEMVSKPSDASSLVSDLPKLIELIKSKSAVAKSKKKATSEQLQEKMLKEYGTMSLAQLTADQAKQLDQFLTSLIYT